MFSKDFIIKEAIYGLNKIVDIEQKVKRDHLIYKRVDKKKDTKYTINRIKNPTKFLDTEIVRHNSAMITTVYTRSNTFSVYYLLSFLCIPIMASYYLILNYIFNLADVD